MVSRERSVVSRERSASRCRGRFAGAFARSVGIVLMAGSLAG
jgi:hypothetical protein